MKLKILILLFLLPLPICRTFAQTGSISGVVIDSLTGQPVANLTVFIPFTTVGTTTDRNGNYRIDKLPPGEHKLMFRHLSYLSVSRLIIIEPGKEVVLNISLSEAPQYIDEVTIVGRKPNSRVAYNVFKQYFLGDVSESSCKLENPDVLNYHVDGNILEATAKEPLIITNHHLGYRITFFLDYFQCFNNSDSIFNFNSSGNFSYSGNAFFEDLTEKQPLLAIVWKINRNNEFRGSLRQFLACLYSNDLEKNHYTIKRPYHNSGEIQRAWKLSNAMTRVRMAQMDSIAYWNYAKGKSEILFFDPSENYHFSSEELRQGSNPDIRLLSLRFNLLVFQDQNMTGKISDSFVSILRLPEGGISFDKEGSFRARNGEPQWVNLDNNLQVKRMLPNDFMKKTKESFH